MTIKEFYEWAVQNGIENFKMANDGFYGIGEYTEEDWRVVKEEQTVYTDWEC